VGWFGFYFNLGWDGSDFFEKLWFGFGFFMVWVSWVVNLCFGLVRVKIHKRVIGLGLG